jgi:hypothetical protein
MTGPTAVDAAVMMRPFFEALGQDSSAVAYVREVGDRIAAAWKRADHAEHRLVDIATEVLSSVAVPADLNVQMLAAVACTQPLVPQHDLDARFGEPPITLYCGPGFNLAALVWLDGTTIIHEHAFSGAFTVLTGSSIHTEYTFEPSWEVSRRLAFGTLHCTGSEVLRRGDTRPIHAGSRGTHALFHLERPSITLVARSDSEPWARPQRSLWRPGIAYDPFDQPTDLMRRLQVLAAMRTIDAIAAVALADSVIDHADLLTGWLVLVDWAKSEVDDDVLAHLVDTYCARDERLRAYVPEAVARHRRERAIVKLRTMLRGARHRFLLATVLSLPDAESCARIIATLHPDRAPGELYAELLDEIAAEAEHGTSAITATPDTVRTITNELRAAGPDTDLAGLVHRALQAT